MSKLSREIKLGLLTGALLLIVLLVGFGVRNALQRRQGQADSDCQSAAHSSVVTMFYRSDTSTQAVQTLARSIDATHAEAYPNNHAYSFTVSDSSVTATEHKLRANSQVTNVQVSRAQDCIDPN